VRRHRQFAIGTLAAALLALLPVGASASNAVLTLGGPDGPRVTSGTFLTAESTGQVTFTSEQGDVTCSNSLIAADVTANPSAPGTAILSIGSLSFAGCTSSIPGTTGVDSIAFDNLPYTMSISDSPSPTADVDAGSAGPIQVSLKLSTLSKPAPCGYVPASSSMRPAISNAGMVFGVDEVPPPGGIIDPGPCPKHLRMSVAYGAFLDFADMQGVFVN
jgi:hypothetical protein